MEKIKICKGINVSNKIFTKTWQELEKFFGVPLTEFGNVMLKKLKSIDEEVKFIYIIISQENNISKEELLEKIDKDDDSKVNIFGVIKKILKIFTSQMESSSDQIGAEDKNLKNQ